MRGKCFREKRMLSIKCNNFCSNFSKGGRRPGQGWLTARQQVAPLLVSPHNFSIFPDILSLDHRWGGTKALVCQTPLLSHCRPDSLAPAVASLQLSKTRDPTLLRFSEPARLREGRDERWRQPRPGPVSLLQTFKIILQSNFNFQRDHSRNWFLVS